MGRAPCCDKANVKRGPWSPEEDAKLKSYIEKHGTGGNWIALPQKIGLKRCGKSCRLRWLNYLRPNIKHGGFSEEEDNIICSLYISIGSRWSIIAAQLPGRTDNDIKNYWNTKLKKKLLGKQRKEKQTRQSKQEIKRETEEYYPLSAGGIMSQSTPPYWPDIMLAPAPAPANPNQAYTHFKDQESLRNLLIKLGGRFSDHQQTFQYPLDHAHFAQDQVVYDNNSINIIASSTSMSPIESANTPSYDVQGFENFQMELSELMYGNGNHQLPQQFDEFGNFYGMEGGSGSSTSVESSSWGGEMNPLANFQQIVSGFEGGQLQSLPSQVTNLEESSYFRPQ